MLRPICGLVIAVSMTWTANGAERSVAERLKRETWVKDSRLVASAIGITRQGTSIPCWIDKAELANDPKRKHVWLVGGLDGSDVGVDATIRIMRQFHERPKGEAVPDGMALSAVIIANPDSWAKQLGEKNDSGGQPTRGYPPKGDAYQSQTDSETQCLWRWLGTQAPDWVVEVRSDANRETAKERQGWWCGLLATNGGRLLIELMKENPDRTFPFRMDEKTYPEQDSLVMQLPREALTNNGPIPASRLCVSDASFERQAVKLEELASLTDQLLLVESSTMAIRVAPQTRRELLARTPIEVAEQLAKRYGRSLKTVQYIPSIAVIGRLRLGELTNQPALRLETERLLEPYVSGEKRAISDKPSGSDFAGHLVFGEMAQRTNDEVTKAKLIALAKAAADFGFDADGKPRESMPSHVEMSDAVFMSCPILAQVGKLTGDVKYHDMAVRHLAFMRKLCARPDGLYRNSPLNDAAWGRGNGFPALGLALTLTDMPADHPGRAEVLRAFQEHLVALKSHQDPTGMWHQVIDVEGSYRELTATCMITFAMLRGVKHGWLDRATYEPCVTKSWPAILARIGSDGSLIDVCEGTGKQTSLRAYLDRKAILGFDDRGGAMSLLVATEMATFPVK